MPRFTYSDLVTAIEGAQPALRPGEPASVIAVIEEKDRKGSYLSAFPPGVIYSIEFEDGSAIDIHESQLRSAEK